jgi:hypothetical protein
MKPLSRAWKKSSRSTPQGGNCVEVRRAEDENIQVRDSKNPNGPILSFSSADWDAFIDGTKAGDFNV